MLFSQNGWFLLAVWTGPSVPWEWWVAGWQYVSCPTWHHPSPPQSNTQPLPSLRFSRQREDWEPWPQARQINSLIIKILSPSVPTSVWIVYSHFIAFFADKSLYVEQCDDINIETYPSLSLSLSFSLFIIQTSDNSNLLPANVWVYLYHNLTPPTDKLEIHKLVLSLSRHSN